MVVGREGGEGEGGGRRGGGERRGGEGRGGEGRGGEGRGGREEEEEAVGKGGRGELRSSSNHLFPRLQPITFLATNT